MPRCRTAWLTAVFNALGSRTYHDVYVTKPDYMYPGTRNFGVIDPAVALMDPFEALVAFKGYPVWHVYADDFDDRIRALEKWSGHPGHPEQIEMYRENLAKFMHQTPGFHVDLLDDSEQVATLYQTCTGADADMEIIEIFQLLKIEEHYPKAKRLLDKMKEV